MLLVMHAHTRQCQCERVQSACAVVFVRYCPPTGYLHREHDIKRDRVRQRKPKKKKSGEGEYSSSGGSMSGSEREREREGKER